MIQKSQEQKLRLLSTVSQNWESWRVKVLKIKAIYHVMNMFHTEGKNYIAECFVPTQDLDTAQMAINHATVCMMYICSRISCAVFLHIEYLMLIAVSSNEC